MSLNHNEWYFTFDNTFYRQQFGLVKWSLSGLFVWIFLEFLESSLFKNNFPLNSMYFICMNDSRLKYTQDPIIVNKLNKVDPTIKFAFKPESTDTRHFQDIMLHKNNELILKLTGKLRIELTWSIFSRYGIKIKSGIILKIYLRGQIICNPQYLPGEVISVENNYNISNILFLFSTTPKKSHTKYTTVKTISH